METKMRPAGLATLILSASLVLSLSQGSAQQDEKIMTGDESVEEMIKQFRKQIRPGTVQQDKPIPAETAGIEKVPAAPFSAGISFPILFPLNSAELTPGAERLLDKIGAALSSPEIKDHHFAVEGHTDARGHEEYNMRLSERRAQSVYRYLIGNQGVQPDRLEAVGKGETELLPGIDPDSGENRRVRLVPLD